MFETYFSQSSVDTKDPTPIIRTMKPTAKHCPEFDHLMSEDPQVFQRVFKLSVPYMRVNPFNDDDITEITHVMVSRSNRVLLMAMQGCGETYIFPWDPERENANFIEIVAMRGNNIPFVEALEELGYEKIGEPN